MFNTKQYLLLLTPKWLIVPAWVLGVMPQFTNQARLTYSFNTAFCKSGVHHVHKRVRSSSMSWKLMWQLLSFVNAFIHVRFLSNWPLGWCLLFLRQGLEASQRVCLTHLGSLDIEARFGKAHSSFAQLQHTFM